MNIKKAFLIIVLLLNYFDVSSQSISNFERISNHVFSDGIISGKLHEFRHVFVSDKVSLKLFDKFNRTRKTQVIVNLSGLAMTVVGYFVADNFVNESSGGSSDGAVVLTALGIVAIGPTILLFSNPILGTVKHRRKKNLLEKAGLISYNDSEAVFGFSAAFTMNGLGLIVNF